MTRFLDRYLPKSERRTALWLAFGGAGLTWAATAMGRQVGAYMQVDSTGMLTPPATVTAVSALAQFALVALLVVPLIRFARAPKAFALYVLLGAAVGVAMGILGLPLAYLGDKRIPSGIALSGAAPWVSSAKRVLEDLAVGLGAAAGAWIAATVSLARIRDAGFSGDEPDREGLSTTRPKVGWGFLGWEGRGLAGDSLLAVAFVITSAAVGLVFLVLNTIAGALVPFDPFNPDPANAAAIVVTLAAPTRYTLSRRPSGPGRDRRVRRHRRRQRWLTHPLWASSWAPSPTWA